MIFAVAKCARAKFVTLESDNHVVLAGEPAWPRLIGRIATFRPARLGRKHAPRNPTACARRSKRQAREPERRLNRYAAATRSASFLRA